MVLHSDKSIIVAVDGESAVWSRRGSGREWQPLCSLELWPIIGAELVAEVTEGVPARSDTTICHGRRNKPAPS